MLADHLFKNVPDLRALALHQPLGRLDGRGFAADLQFVENKGLEQLERHFLWQPALVEPTRRPYREDRAAGIIAALPSRFWRKRPCLPLIMSASDLSGRRLVPV